ncbi:CLUMA_CG005224, isoform A [Clunio marinus]|uniref:CLUMA_CG005224, isoform A n=1 Tax=Clunio marinus TaxID=568069 RepID=A0A1J1HVI9_9DIPT|nr:CLUMA_CG005224, isoform A [Clunio marinus]
MIFAKGFLDIKEMVTFKKYFWFKMISECHYNELLSVGRKVKKTPKVKLPIKIQNHKTKR